MTGLGSSKTKFIPVKKSTDLTSTRKKSIVDMTYKNATAVTEYDTTVNKHHKLVCAKVPNGNLIIQQGDEKVLEFYTSADSTILHVEEFDGKLDGFGTMSMEIDGIYGCYILPSGIVLAVIVSSEEVYTSPVSVVNNGKSRKRKRQRPLINLKRVKRIELVPIPQQSNTDSKGSKSRTVNNNPSLPSTDSSTDVLLLSSIPSAVTNKEEARQLLLLRRSIQEHDFYFTSPARMVSSAKRTKVALHDVATNRVQSYFLAALNQSNSEEAIVNFEVNENDNKLLCPDSRFFWNEDLVALLRHSKAYDWIIPCTSAYVGVSRDVPFQTSNSKSKSANTDAGLMGKIWNILSRSKKVSPASISDVEGLLYDQVLISRRSRFRAGTRFTRRGSDESGNVANYVESEQLVFVKSLFTIDTEKDTDKYELLDVHSFVQTRGSIPLLWSSPAHVTTYTPKVRIGTDALSQARALRTHIFDQLQKYAGIDFSSSRPKFIDDSWKIFLHENAKRKGKRQGNDSLLTIVNLIDKHGDQGRLGETLDSVLNVVLDIHSDFGRTVVDKNMPSLKNSVKHTWFDFHAECRKSNGGWNKLNVLLELLEDDMERHGYFSARPTSQDGSFKILRIQEGVIRTNCMDCLDRTNVVQSLFARKLLFRQLQQRPTSGKQRNLALEYVIAFTKKDPLHLPWGEGEISHRLIWADNADAISNLYAGTNALKRDYTRTGKRTKLGALDDGVNSVTRFYINNFIDADRQEGVDLMTHTQPFSNAETSFESGLPKLHEKIIYQKDFSDRKALDDLGIASARNETLQAQYIDLK